MDRTEPQKQSRRAQGLITFPRQQDAGIMQSKARLLANNGNVLSLKKKGQDMLKRHFLDRSAEQEAKRQTLLNSSYMNPRSPESSTMTKTTASTSRTPSKATE